MLQETVAKKADTTLFYSEYQPFPALFHPIETLPPADSNNGKNIAELKALVNPRGDETVRRAKKEILQEIEPLNEGRASKKRWLYVQKALEYVKSLETFPVSLGGTQWRSPAETIQEGGGDPLDKALLLCALLTAGGHQDARVRVVALECGPQHAFVLFSFGGKQALLDATDEKPSFASAESLEETLANHRCLGKRVARSLYEFDEQHFDFLSEE